MDSPFGKPWDIARALSRGLPRELGDPLIRAALSRDTLPNAVAAIPPARVEQIMRSPARRVVLDGLFWGLPAVLGQVPAHEVVRTLRVHVTGRPDGTPDTYWAAHRDGRWSTGRGEPEVAPELTLTVEASELIALVSRRTSIMQAWFGGTLRASGNAILAARLALLIRPFSAGGGDAPRP